MTSKQIHKPGLEIDCDSKMSVFCCGINACSQIWEGGPHIVCCPIPITCFQGITEVQLTFSHILWKTTLGWMWTGYKNHDVSDLMNIDSQWKIFVSENRLAAINTFDSVVIWEKKGWRTLHFQNDYGKEVETTDLCLLEKKIEKYSESEVNKEDCENYSSLRRVSSVDDIRSTLGFKKQDCLIRDSLSECEMKESDTMQDSSKQKLKVEHLTEPQGITCDANSSTSCSTQARDKSHRTENSDLSFCHIAVEDNALFAVDRGGVLYSGCVPLSLKLKITEVALGKEHSMALTADGILLTWGSGMRGQLGNGELCQSEKPVPVESLQGIAISSIVCGGWHSIALSQTGDAYVWGWNESGQLGFPAKSQGNLSVIESIEHQCQCFENFPAGGKRICKNVGKDTMCDYYSTSHCKTEPQLENLDKYPNKNNDDDSSFEGKVDQVKRKKQNRRPSDSRINQKHNIDVINVQASPKLLDFWSEDVNIVDIQCGDRHTLFQLDDGSVWSVGMNKYGQLGLGHTEAIEGPAEVFSKGVIRIYAGGWNSIFFTM